MNEIEIKQVVEHVLTGMQPAIQGKQIPVEVSARHVHLTKEDVEELFGSGHTLTEKRPISQQGQFLAEERVSIVTAKGEFRNVAVLGPERAHTQVELSMADARTLGIRAPIRMSGDVKGSSEVAIFSGSGMIRAEESVIVAQRHVHMTPQDAQNYGVHDGQCVKVRMNTQRPIDFRDVQVRVGDNATLALHIDVDEANACALQDGDICLLVPEDPAESLPKEVDFIGGNSAEECRFGGKPCTQNETGFCGSVQKEHLITDQFVREYIKTGVSVLCVEPGTLVTPLAQDTLREKKIDLVYAASGDRRSKLC